MVDTINNATEATSPEKVERLIPVYNTPENQKPAVERHIFDECLTPECDC